MESFLQKRSKILSTEGFGKREGGTLTATTANPQINVVSNSDDDDIEFGRIKQMLNYFDVSPTDDNIKLVKKWWDGQAQIGDVSAETTISLCNLQRASLPCMRIMLHESKTQEKGLFDSGAGASVISQALVDKLGCKLEPCDSSIRVADKKSIAIKNKVRLKCSVGDQTGTIVFLVADELSHNIILGNDFITLWKVIPSIHKGTFTFEGSKMEYKFLYNGLTYHDCCVLEDLRRLLPELLSMNSALIPVKYNSNYIQDHDFENENDQICDNYSADNSSSDGYDSDENEFSIESSRFERLLERVSQKNDHVNYDVIKNISPKQGECNLNQPKHADKPFNNSKNIVQNEMSMHSGHNDGFDQNDELFGMNCFYFPNG